MYTVNKFVSQYYIYIDDDRLGLCYLKISSYLPFAAEFYLNGHNYLKKQFDLEDKKYTMKKDNSFTKVEDLEMLNNLVTNFQPSIALDRINHWINIFFKFNQGQKSTRSKLLQHNWYTYQTEISTNLIFKSAKFANTYFERILSKHHTIGLPDKLTEIFSLSRQKNNSKTTKNKYKTKAVIKHWLERNSINLSLGFRSKDLKQFLGKEWKTAKIAYELRKLRERGAVKKLQNTHYYRLTKEGYVWIFFSFFNSNHVVKPLLSGGYKSANLLNSDQASIIEEAYSDINKAVAMIMTEFKIAS